MEELSSCPVCGHTHFTPFLTAKDHTVSKEQFQILECKECGFVFTNPRPLQENLGKYYKSTAYVSHSDTSDGIINKLYKQVRKITLNQKYNLVKPYLENNNLLDIGSGAGAFLNTVYEKGVNAFGVEPDKETRESSIKKYGINVKEESALSEFDKDYFSVITMWHVLEHVPNLEERVLEIKRILSPNGRLFVAVPNHTSFDANYYKEHWAAYDVPRHLYHFSPVTIRKLFNKHNMVLEQVIPMKFDSFYVSMLSEQYKNGKPNLLKGILSGLKSNIMAENDTYSSQIYVIKR
jgi:SAM-dependent methyltransferase